MTTNKVAIKNDQGQWVPAIPLPLYTYSWLRRRFDCECGERFKTESAYRGHFALTHVMGLS